MFGNNNRGRINMAEENNNKIKGFSGFVPWVVFVYVIGMSVWLYNGINNRVDAIDGTARALELQQASMKASYEETFKNIDKNLTDINKKLEILSGRK